MVDTKDPTTAGACSYHRKCFDELTRLYEVRWRE